MKKTFLYGLMACLSLAFYACGSDSDDKGAIPGNSRSTTPPSYQKEPKADCANKFISNAGNVEFFGNGKYSMPAGMKDKSLSARQMRMSPAAPDTYATGTYDYADGVYTLDNGTTITVNGNSLLFDYGKDNVESYDVKAASKVISTAQTIGMCRTWNIKKTRISVDYDGTNVAHEFSGFNPNEIAQYAIGKGVQMEGDYANHKLQNVYFSPYGTYMLTYDDGTYEIGKWSINGNTVKYTWDSEEYGFEFENGDMYVEWEGQTMVLTYTAKFTSGSTTYNAKMTWWVAI